MDAASEVVHIVVFYATYWVACIVSQAGSNVEYITSTYRMIGEDQHSDCPNGTRMGPLRNSNMVGGGGKERTVYLGGGGVRKERFILVS